MDGLLKNIDILNHTLNGLWLRNEVINHNISNANTPNYKRLTVNFEDALKEALNKRSSCLVTTHENHISNIKSLDDIQSNSITSDNYSYRIDGNSVDIDVESANLAKNAIMYNAVISQLTDEFDKLKSVINEGR
jgi:flagellar basal-body rod protein FlgB